MKKSVFYVLLTAVLFTTLEPVSKLISSGIHPVGMTCVRFLTGGLLLLPFSIRAIRQMEFKPTGGDYLKMVFLGVLCVCVSMPLLQYAVMLGDSPSLIAIIFSSNAVFTILLAAIILKERVTVWKMGGVLLCLAGIIICVDFKAGTNMVSVVLAIAASLTFSAYTVAGKKLTSRLSGVVQTGFSFFFGGVVLLAVLLITGTGIATAEITPVNLLILLYLGIGVTGIGYWSYFTAMEKSSAMAASLVFFIKPVLTPFFAYYITGTQLTAQTFAALVFVIAGSAVATTKKLERYRNPYSRE